MYEKIKPGFKFFFSVFVVSWLGSYSYDTLKVAKKTDNVFESLSKIPSNLVDSSIENVMNNNALNNFGFIISIFFICSIIMYVLDLKTVLKNKTANKKFLKVFWNISLIIFSIYCVVLSLFTLSFNTLINSHLQNNIEIIRPYITEKEYILFKSDFFQIDNYDDYSALNSKINKLSKENNLKTK